MKTKYLMILTILFSSFWGYALFAEESEKVNQVNVNVQIRPRAEYRNGYRNPVDENDKAAGFINQRARLSINYENKSGLSTNISLQNVRVWGQYPAANAASNTVINEAWAQLQSDNGLFMKFGRQQLHYNDGRILAHSDWNPHGVFHDALKFGYNDNANQLDLAIAYNQEGERVIGGTFYPSSGMPYKNMQMAYYQYNGIAGFTPAFIAINMGYQHGTAETPKMTYLQTVGTHMTFAPVKDLTTRVVAYYQMGTRRPTEEKVSAAMLGLQIDYKATKEIKLFGGLDYLTGQDHNTRDNSNTFNAFNTIHGGNHAFYGSMDLFIASPYNDGMNLGLFDKYIGINYSPKPKYQFLARFHHFSMAANAYNDSNEKIAKSLGSEIDLQFDYSVMPGVKLICGYSTFFGTESVKFAKGGNPKTWQDWAFLTINVNPRVFSSKW